MPPSDKECTQGVTAVPLRDGNCDSSVHVVPPSDKYYTQVSLLVKLHALKCLCNAY